MFWFFFLDWATVEFLLFLIVFFPHQLSLSLTVTVFVYHYVALHISECVCAWVCMCVTSYSADGCSSLSHLCGIIRVSGLNRSGVGKGGL